MRKITFYLVLFALSLSASYAQIARVQVIHNSADAAAEVVDVYVNGDILLDDFEFRTASPFVDAPAGVPLTIVVAPGNSTSAADGIFTANATLTANETYIIVANGIVSTTGYTPNQPFNLYIYDMGREEASMAANTDVLVFHGATDAPAVDAVESGTPAVNDISYGQFQGYLELPTEDYVLDITTADNSTVVESYSVPLDLLNLDGTAITVLASGFLNPANNSNGPAFGLWVALPSGGPLVQLPMADDMARVQIIHNSADIAAAVVDVYVNGDILLNDFAFRTATPFIDAQAGLPLTIDVAPGNSSSADDSIYSVEVTLQSGETYVVVANGIVSTTGYTPNQPFNLYIYNMGREEASMAANTDLLVFHGATDAPTVDVTAQGAGTLVDNISYTEFNDMYLELPTDDYTISITTADGNTTVATYSAPLETLNLQGQALTVLASGFLDPSMNSNGPAFGLWAALPTGGDLVQLPLSELSTQDFYNTTVSVYPNPANDLINIMLPDGYNSIATTVYDMAGRDVLVSSGTSVNISSLNSGIYIANINIDGITVTRRIVKE